ncbi:hypothetical protein FHG87_013673 [Trinorchestia longiramus]|nr:hypothetical protein FHG87_013673 [Trinorchestia longiramus]
MCYDCSLSTIYTILMKKNKIEKLDVAKTGTMITKQHSKLLDVEKLLLVWINKKQVDSVSEGIKRTNSVALHVDLARKTPGTSRKDEVIYKASRG